MPCVSRDALLCMFHSPVRGDRVFTVGLEAWKSAAACRTKEQMLTTSRRSTEITNL